MLKKILIFFILIAATVIIIPQDDPNVPFAGVRLKDTNKGGPQVIDVIENSPADKMNLQKGDVITHINNEDVDNTSEFLLKLYSFDPDDKIDVKFKRNNKQYSKTMILTARTDDYAYIFKNLPTLIKFYKIKLKGDLLDEKGFAAENLNKQLFDYFNVKSGIIVTYVKKGSIADKKGFKAGDIIVEMNNKNIRHTVDFREIYDKNEKLNFVIKRRDKTINIRMEK